MLHDTKSLSAAVSEILAGKREINTELERLHVLEALDKRNPEISYDAERAILEGADHGLERQAFDAAPAAVKADPALLRGWMLAARRGRKAKPPIDGVRVPSIEGAPPTPPQEVAFEAREKFAREILRAGAHVNLNGEGVQEQLAGMRGCGNFGNLGQLLCGLDPHVRIKAIATDRAFGRGLLSKLGILVCERDPSGRASKFPTVRPLKPSSRRDVVHANVKGSEQLCWVCEIKSDGPPSDLLEGLDAEWQWSEVKGLTAGAYVLITSAAKAAES